MIKVEQVPMDVKRAMRAAWARRSNSDAPEKIMADLLIAALNAWPGQRNDYDRKVSEKWIGVREFPIIILPLAENTND